MKTQNRISELLHSIFGSDAIQAGAICEQLEDVGYCAEHKMTHTNGGSEQEKWNALREKAEKLAAGDATFSVENMRRFQVAANELMRKNPGTRLLDGLSEVEHYAARKFYYYNCH